MYQFKKKDVANKDHGSSSPNILKNNHFPYFGEHTNSESNTTSDWQNHLV